MVEIEFCPKNIAVYLCSCATGIFDQIGNVPVGSVILVGINPDLLFLTTTQQQLWCFAPGACRATGSRTALLCVVQKVTRPVFNIFYSEEKFFSQRIIFR
jgi:hypothetical protein